MFKPLIISNAPNGSTRTKKDHPQLPITPHELAKCAEQVQDAGASLFHVHVRDDKNLHSLSIKRYKDAILAIKNRVGDDLIIQITTEACGKYSRADQINLIKTLKPEAVSIALREICPTNDTIEDTKHVFEWIASHNIFPQIILYDRADVRQYIHLLEQGIFGQRHQFILYVLGKNNNVIDSYVNDLMWFNKHASLHNLSWSVCCFGKTEHQASKLAIEHNGHVRVGFENNIWDQNDKLVARNETLVTSARLHAKTLKRPVATASDIRKFFKLNYVS